MGLLVLYHSLILHIDRLTTVGIIRVVIISFNISTLNPTCESPLRNCLADTQS